MKEIKLTKGKVALVDDADFEFLSQWKWSVVKKKNGFYACRDGWTGNYSKKTFRIYMHRQIMGCPDLPVMVDHHDHDTLNNQKYNLRLCTNAENQCNRKKASGTTSKYKGVSLTDRRYKKWLAKIEVKDKPIFIGRFPTEAEAAIAYNEKAKFYFGEFANLNQI